VNDRYVLKLFRRIEAGPNPEFEIGQALTVQEFSRIPPLAGGVVIDRPNEEPGTLAVAQALVTNQGSGWSFTIDELRRYYERVEARVNRGDGEGMTAQAEEIADTDGAEPPPFFAALEGWYLAAAGVLGRRTAELHLALANAPGPAFAPEPLDRGTMREYAENIERQAGAVLDLLAARMPSLPDDLQPIAASLLERREAIVARAHEVDHIVHGGQRIRVHGDYHLGQVLRTEEDFVILDFEGEPARTLAERRAKYSPLKDVAGMLRSFSYASTAALMAFTQSSTGAMERLAPWAKAWQHWVSRSFLDAYRRAMVGTKILPTGYDFDALLDAFTLEKALYELGYELNNRPEWTRIPLNALVTLALPLQR
jgi:maltose alpha-D-glucosyltransferase/alpha-amylase